ncbi:MAG: hypothetical protein FJ009_07830 [Chloroflexi bacterium]|nr:hypothetical protein [Chloroflexota bacterium]
MPKQSIPEEIKKQADEIVAAFNQKVIKNPNRLYVPRYKGRYLYLDCFDYGHRGARCRLTYMGSIDKWEFAIFKYSDERYDSEDWFFPGSEHVDGTIEGAMKAGLAAYP